MIALGGYDGVGQGGESKKLDKGEKMGREWQGGFKFRGNG